jgi:ankyrin repeat protein
MPQDIQKLLRSLSDVMFPSDPDTPVRVDSVGYDGDTPLHVVAWRNDLDAVLLLIDAGADVNAKGEMDETPLHIAVHHGNPRMVQAMLRAGGPYGHSKRVRRHGERSSHSAGRGDLRPVRRCNAT